jgi:hypothetical protein
VRRGSKEVRLERFLVENHVAPAGVKCGKGDDGYDYVCTFRARGRVWKQGFLFTGPRVTAGSSPVLVADHLPAGPRPEPDRRARLVRLLTEVCSRATRRFSRDQEAEVVRLEPLVPAALLPDFTAFAGAFAGVVNARQEERDVVASGAPRRVVRDVAKQERAAREQLRANARRLGFDCG